MKSGVFTYLIAVLLLLWQPVNSQNLLYDGDFSLTTEIDNCYGYPPPGVWCEYIGYYITADATVVDGVCTYKIENPGYDNWEVQLIQAGFTLEPMHQYRLKFDIKADKACAFGVFLGENEGNWTSLVGYDRYWQNAGAEWTTITLDFKAPCTFAYHKLSFEFGLQENNTLYFDNVSITDLGAYAPEIGVIGTAVNGGWDVDVNMETTDGIHFTLDNFPLSNGRMKFRQDDMWCNNWGGLDFPSGAGYLYGPDIPVSNKGIYDISFNIQTGEYSFVCVNNCSPYIGIIGTAVPPGFGSEPDVNLQTSDGKNYWLDQSWFATGELKFRQDDKWDNNWGATGFPDGIATKGGDPVPVKEGIYNLTFNVVTGEYHFAYPNIGILGSALNGWDEDINMETTDGIVYTLHDYQFSYGEVKFRAEDNWNVNWGGDQFPTGFAWSYGPNIPVMAGTYDVMFNMQTGEYLFEATSCPVPNIQCPYDIYVMAEPGSCEAMVFYPEVKAAPNCGGEGVTIEQIEGLPSGSVFPVGQTLNTFMLTNKEGNTAYCSFYVMVMEPEPPVITMNVDSFEPLWPPDHKMVNFYLDYTVTDNCSTPNTYLYVWSNEPEIGMGEGDKSPDWEIVDGHNVLLRAERSAKGTGREYYIYIVANDNSWNYDFRMITVKVPHDMGVAEDKPAPKNKSAIIDKDLNNGLLAEIWPNPADRMFNLKTKGELNEKLAVSVTDLTGRIVDNFNIKSNETQLFGETLKPGIYIVSVRRGIEMQYIRIVKTQ